MASAVQQFTGAYSRPSPLLVPGVSASHGSGVDRTGFADVEARLERTADGYRLVGRARADSIGITAPPEFRAHVVEGAEFDAGNHPHSSVESASCNCMTTARSNSRAR